MCDLRYKQQSNTKMDPQTWLKNKWPNMKVCDVNWTMERYDYPQNVRQWIFENWIKMNDNNGGTYSEPEYFNQKYKNNSTSTGGIENPEEPEESKESEKSDKSDNDGRGYAKVYQKTAFAKGMDDNNKKALNVMATEGFDAAVKHMFKHPENGRQLSYGEMRMFYG